ncbi:MAG: hypothetical protein KKB51_04610 [Candidatus Riflebacteria bacterium]|nr:hypothetical protein [Candidatus Riflebacteria bacterium]
MKKSRLTAFFLATFLLIAGGSFGQRRSSKIAGVTPADLESSAKRLSQSVKRGSAAIPLSQAAKDKVIEALKGKFKDYVATTILGKLNNEEIKSELYQKMVGVLEERKDDLIKIGDAIADGNPAEAQTELATLFGTSVLHGLEKAIPLNQLKIDDSLSLMKSGSGRLNVMGAVLGEVIQNADKIKTVSEIAGLLSDKQWKAAGEKAAEFFPQVQTIQAAVVVVRQGFEENFFGPGMDAIYNAWRVDKTQNPDDLATILMSTTQETGMKGIEKSGHLRTLAQNLGWPDEGDEERLRRLGRYLQARDKSETDAAAKEKEILVAAVEMYEKEVPIHRSGLGSGKARDKALDQDILAYMKLRVNLAGGLARELGLDASRYQSVMLEGRSLLALHVKSRLELEDLIQRQGPQSPETISLRQYLAKSRNDLLKTLRERLGLPAVKETIEAGFELPGEADAGEVVEGALIIEKGIPPFSVTIEVPGQKNPLRFSGKFDPVIPFSFKAPVKPGAHAITARIEASDGDKGKLTAQVSAQINVSAAFNVVVAAPKFLGFNQTARVEVTVFEGTPPFTVTTGGTLPGKSAVQKISGRNHTLPVTAGQKPGAFTIWAEVESADKKTARSELEVAVGPPFQVLFLNAPKQVPAGSNVTLGFSLEGGSPLLKPNPPWDVFLKGSGVSKAVSGKITNKRFSLSFTAPKKTGMCEVTVEAGGTVFSASAKHSFKVVPGFAIDLTGPRSFEPNQEKDLSVEVSGAVAAYRVMFRGPMGNDKEVLQGQPQSDGAVRKTIMFKAPSKVGEYTLQVRAVDTSGKQVTSTLRVSVKKADSSEPDEPDKSNTTKEVRSTPSGNEVGPAITLTREYLTMRFQTEGVKVDYKQSSWGPFGGNASGIITGDRFRFSGEATGIDDDPPPEFFCRGKITLWREKQQPETITLFERQAKGPFRQTWDRSIDLKDVFRVDFEADLEGGDIACYAPFIPVRVSCRRPE